MKLFYGWVIVATGIVVTCMALGSMTSLSIFLQPISQTMGWSRTSISIAALLNFLSMGIGSFFWGAVSDRFGTRVVVASGGTLLGIGLVAASQATTLGWFQALFGLIIGFAAGSFYAPIVSATTRWFTTNRTLAVALVSSGMSMGSVTIGPLARWLTTNYDWRLAMLVIGDLAWLVIIPAAFLLREPAKASAAAAAAANVDGNHNLTMGQILRTPQFIAIALTHFACCAAHSGPIFHMVTNAMDHGVAAMAATTVLSAAGIASFGGRIICGLVADRVGVKRTLVASLALQAVAVSLYLVTRELGGFYALAMMFGFSYGGVMPLYPVLIREYFGQRVMGRAFGAVGAVATLGMAIGPWAGGWLYDSYGSYFWLFVASASIGAGAVAIAVTFRPPRRIPAALPSPSLAG